VVQQRAASAWRRLHMQASPELRLHDSCVVASTRGFVIQAAHTRMHVPKGHLPVVPQLADACAIRAQAAHLPPLLEQKQGMRLHRNAAGQPRANDSRGRSLCRLRIARLPGARRGCLLAHGQGLHLVVWSEKLVYFGENRQGVRTIEQILFEYSRAKQPLFTVCIPQHFLSGSLTPGYG